MPSQGAHFHFYNGAVDRNVAFRASRGRKEGIELALRATYIVAQRASTWHACGFDGDLPKIMQVSAAPSPPTRRASPGL